MTDYQKRMALLAECRKMDEELKGQLARMDEDESLSDDEYDSKTEALFEAYRLEHGRKWAEAFFLQFPKRRGWFAETFIPSFGECESKRLSVKQTEVVSKYCVSDGDTWTTGKTYCRAGDKLITLSVPRYSKGIGYLTVRSI